jgi:arylsulfatase A-like enzyme
LGNRKLRRREFLLAGAAAGIGCSNEPRDSTPPARSEFALSPERVGDQIGPVQKGNGLNLILIVSDSLRADYLGCYGNRWIRTPNLDLLSKRSVQFTECYAESLPTLPARRVLLTGRRAAPLRFYPQQSDPVQAPGWHPLFYEDITLPEWLLAAGYTTGYVTDVPHVQKPGKNFHRGFEAFRFIRGNGADRWVSGPQSVPLSKYSVDGKGSDTLRQYLMNRRGWKDESDSCVAQVVRQSAQWLMENRDNQPFFLYVDCFDPHEPWDPPDRYARMYHRAHKGPKLIVPPSTTDKLTKEQVLHIRSLYAGEVTLVDAWIGRLLDQVAKLDLYRNTVIAFVADHGTIMGEQGQIRTGNGDRTRRQVVRVPLLICQPDPAWAGKKVGAFVQHTDVMPTLLGLLRMAPPARITGEDAWPLVTGSRDKLRDTVVTQHGYYAAVRTNEWSYLASIDAHKAGRELEELYDLRADPAELINVAAGNSKIVRDMRARLRRYLDAGEDLTGGSFGPAAT